MKFHQTEFARQIFAVIAGSVFLVAGVAFTVFPGALAQSQPTMAWHLT